ncbi:hypothetical protein [Amycolatopsis antarctica]|uniref:hypothetical protein n=1 Tax=Amycolatopsis antarctica TaxID=1854586 RepID=UPI001F0A07C0|nr:hypothetical protein [Amycolatopsis antarctica]
MSEENQSEGKWAPWWVYAIAIVGLNALKQKFLEDSPFVLNLAVTVALIAVIMVGITAAYRGMATKKN